jgi:hypothetical protein
MQPFDGWIGKAKFRFESDGRKVMILQVSTLTMSRIQVFWVITFRGSVIYSRRFERTQDLQLETSVSLVNSVAQQEISFYFCL